ncbi:50S ribosomal protein L35 [Candidatus Peregrinibacteria bacterium]|nr:50S ribosomal protein L35 [Candidatus Peregrinibacteria bacterium]
MMKQRTHSGLKKRVKVRKSGTVTVRKSCKNHLLSNKSKKQKEAYLYGKPVDKTKMKVLRRLMPGIVTLNNEKEEESSDSEEKGK